MKDISLKDIEPIIKKVQKEITTATTLDALQKIHTKYFGRKGKINSILKLLPRLQLEKRREIGKFINTAKDELETVISTKTEELKNKLLQEKLLKEKIDITLPAKKTEFGSLHPITQIINEITSIFTELSFQIVTGPELETDYYNFEALNIPQDHPARDLQDTFYIANSNKKLLLRTHTSPVQIRVMEKYQPPIRVVIPGKVYRHEATDATHSAVFHQVEGLAVDTNITFADLKGTLTFFARRIFNEKVNVRFRPSYFPFTEPSAEMDIECIICEKRGCRVCKGTGWIEILGCGMVHPKVFDAVKYDREKYTGFAFGLGVERIAMLKYKIDDMRLFYENDLRFLSQF
ncbi:MAG: phenylalanine--tRNA ligase subunit alpha [Elusimicrobiota bacterium]|nr:phenylalanine--tRNA ligase subunit alpha [Elusimicrobiota bacterium]